MTGVIPRARYASGDSKLRRSAYFVSATANVSSRTCSGHVVTSRQSICVRTARMFLSKRSYTISSDKVSLVDSKIDIRITRILC